MLNAIWRRLGLERPEPRAWALYDWANSAFVTVVVTAVLPVYFAEVVAKDLEGSRATTLWSWCTTISLAVIAVAAPVLGTLADLRAWRKRLFAVFLTFGIGCTAGLFLVERGAVTLTLWLFGLANIGAAGSFVFYDALLPHVAGEDELDRLSTTAYALGYLGGGLLLLVNLLWILKPALFGLPAEGTLPTRLALLSVALWWGVFSIPLLRRVPEPPGAEVEGGRAGTALGSAVRQLRATLGELRSYRQAFLMMIAFLLYNDGISTMIRMAGIYAKERELESSAIIGAILLVQFVGVPFAVLFGRLAGSIGAKRGVGLGLAAYFLITLLAYRMQSEWEFFALAALVGMVQGGTQALSRSLFASMIPRQRSGEFFGLFGVMEKFAGIFGPLIFALVSQATGSSQSAILAIVPFFIVGGLLLRRVDVEEGRRTAREVEARLG
ncbi:MAG: MFS transporter [Planctomycetota bacterium]|jgi:UMF1 family MFS transporter